MSSEEVVRKIVEHKQREEKAKDDVVAFARQLVFTLRDAGRNSSAQELERLLFIIDAELEDFSAIIRSDMKGFLEAALRMPPFPPPFPKDKP